MNGVVPVVAVYVSYSQSSDGHMPYDGETLSCWTRQREGGNRRVSLHPHMLLLWSRSLQFIDDVRFCAALEGTSTLRWIKTDLAKDGKLLGTNSETASGL